jgi:hypothetical protein
LITNSRLMFMQCFMIFHSNMNDFVFTISIAFVRCKSECYSIQSSKQFENSKCFDFCSWINLMKELHIITYRIESCCFIWIFSWNSSKSTEIWFLNFKIRFLSKF